MLRIVKAAVRIKDLRQGGKIITIPCHRHCDAFWIIKEFGYNIGVDYEPYDQGFIDNEGEFHNRVESFKIAWDALQLGYEHYGKGFKPTELFSEDLW